MRDQGLGVPPTEDQTTDENGDSGSKETTDFENPLASDQLNLWLENAPTFSTISKEITHEGYAITLDDLSSFGVPLSLPLKQSESKQSGIPCLEKGQSSGTKRMDPSEMQTNETTDLQEDGGKEMSDGCKPQKRTCCAEVHNLNERIRRRKLKDKMKVLRELIPNCNKRDKSSTLDDAINYIRILQHQVQMMSTGVGHSALRSPPTMMQQVQLPSFLQTAPLRDGMEYGIGMGIGMGMSNVFPSILPSRNQFGLFDPCLLPSTTTSGISTPTSGISRTYHLVQNSGNLFESSYPTGFQSSGSQSTILPDTSSSQEE